MKNLFLIFTCEHASNEIPKKYKVYFKEKNDIFASHRGYDWGTQHLGKILGKAFNTPVVLGKFSRLLIDLNRSEGHNSALSEMTRDLDSEIQKIIKKTYHRPHWNQVHKLIDDNIKKGKTVIHIGIHSFTPVLNGIIRNTDIGICYDSRRKSELKLARKWQASLREYGELRVRRNYPYSGKCDGLTSSLRRIYSEKKYKGFEIEINQALVLSTSDLKVVEKLITQSLKDIL